MAKLAKRIAKAQEAFAGKANISVEDAVKLIKGAASAKFDETIEIAMNLGVDPRHADQMVRGVVELPHGTGKTVRVAVFAQGAAADQATEAGADLVGFDDLADRIKGGTLDFDVVIATPDSMRVVGQLGKILGPRGLMPNPKTGTVTPDVVTAVRNAKAGQVQFRTDRAGIIHGSIGQVGFDADKIKENLQALLADLRKAKPASAKGIYLKKITLSTTMGPGVTVDQGSLEA